MSQRWREWRRPLRELARASVDLLLPPACIACGEPADTFCGPCARNLHRRSTPGCPRCGEPVVTSGRRCQGDHAELRNVSRLVAPLRYVGTGGALVRRFKLDADPMAAAFLLRTMAEAWRGAADTAWRHAVVVSVPLHRRRRRERGFDQAAWLAAGLARRLRLEPLAEALRRSRETLPQGDPRVLSRTGNVDGAFGLRQPERLRNRRVVLVDDVFTSGATVRACAKLLRAAGAQEVAVLVACRS